MRSWKQISLLTLCVLILLASTPAKPAWQMKADYVEACSCHLFCPCYFNKHAEHPHCEFNMAVKVREGYSGNTNLAGAKHNEVFHLLPDMPPASPSCVSIEIRKAFRSE